MTQTRTDELCRISIECCDRADKREVSRFVCLDVGEIVASTDELRGSNADLLSLRAAVRRVHAAEDVVDNATVNESWAIYRARDEARAALRAEMASLDGNGGAS